MSEPVRIPLGQELAAIINEMGHNPNSFAKLVGVSQGAVLNWINNPRVKPDDESQTKVETTLRKRCRCCRQYTEKEDAWNNPTTTAEAGGRKRKA